MVINLVSIVCVIRIIIRSSRLAASSFTTFKWRLYEKREFHPCTHLGISMMVTLTDQIGDRFDERLAADPCY